MEFWLKPTTVELSGALGRMKWGQGGFAAAGPLERRVRCLLAKRVDCSR